MLKALGAAGTKRSFIRVHMFSGGNGSCQKTISLQADAIAGSPVWVKDGKTPIEDMFSGLPQIADIHSRSRGRLRIQPAGQYRPHALDRGHSLIADDRRDGMVV